MMKKYTIVDDRKQRSEQQKNNGSIDTKYSGKPRGDSLLRDSSAKRASVWVLNGNTLTRRFIRTGLEDGTQVQVLSGLTEADVVVDGVQQAGAKANQNNVRSPFLPQRRTGQTGSGNRPGGGNRPSQ